MNTKRFGHLSIRTVTICLLFMLCFSSAVYALDSDGAYFEPPKLERISDRVVDFKPGEAREIVVTIKNIGDIMARDISVRPTLANANSPLSIEFVGTSDRIGNLSGNGTRNIRLNVRVSGTAAPESYGIDIRFTYRDDYNKLHEKTEVVFIKVDDEAKSPEIIMRDFSTGGGISPGDDFTLTAVLQNVGDANARDVQVLVDGFKPLEINLLGSSNNQYYSALNAGATQDLSLSLTAHRDLKSGSYPLSFELIYRDADNNEKKNTFRYFVNVQGESSSSERANLAIANLSAPSGTFEVGQEFTIAFDLTNLGIEAAKKIRVSTIDNPAVRPRTQSVRTLAELEPRGSSRLSFSFAPTADAKTQNYSMGFKIEYESGENSDGSPINESFEQYVGVNVFNPDEEDEDEEDGLKPRIIIDSYRVDPIIVKAGEEFDIHMVFRNTHATMSIENIKVVLTPQERTNDTTSSNPFMPVDGSNTFYISRIPPGGTATKDFRMYAIPNADPRAYTISVDFEYQDSDFKQHTESEIIGITVKQTTKLDTGNIMVPADGFMFQQVYVNFNLMNTGKSTLNNLTVEIQAEGFETSRSFVYFGSLNKSGSSYYDGEITPMMPGMQSGKVIITYEDDSGEVTTIERDFTMNVMDMGGGDFSEFDRFPMDYYPSDMQGGGFSPMELARNPWVWAGVVALCVAAFFGKKFYDKKKRPQYDE